MTCVVWLLFLEEIQVRVFVTATIFSAGLDIEILANSLCGWWLNFVSHKKKNSPTVFGDLVIGVNQSQVWIAVQYWDEYVVD